MANAEMVIRLVDATAEEQAALDNTPSFNSNGPVPPPVQTPATDKTERGTKAKESLSTEAPTSRWTEALHRVRDALLGLTERFAPKAFQEPIERLINALTPKDEQGNTTQPPPVQTDVQSKPVVDHIGPKQDPDQSTPSKKKKHHDDEKPSWIEGILKKSHFGREVLESYEHTKHKLHKGIEVATKNPIAKKVGFAARRFGKAIAQSKPAQKVGGFAKSAVTNIAQKVGMKAASGAAAPGSASVAGGAAASAGAAGAAEAGAAGSAGAGLAALATPVALTVAAVAASFAILAVSAKALSETFESEVERLTQYSGPLAAVQAHHQLNTELNMLDRAKQAGPGLAKWDTAQGNLNNQMEKLWTQILMLLMKFEPALTTGTNALAVLISEVTKGVAGFDVGMNKILDFAAQWTPDPNDDATAAQNLKDAIDNFNKASKVAQEAWDELQGKGHGHHGALDPMLQAVLDTELDDHGNVVKKHGNAHGGGHH